METKSASNFWWLKSTKTPIKTTVPKLDLEISSSLAEFLEKEQNVQLTDKDEVDVGSIIEEINRVAAQSPLGPFNSSQRERSIDDIMKEAEKIYMESSKSFEQLSQRSKTSQNVSDLHTLSNGSTPTPKSLSPLPLDNCKQSDSDSDSYNEDFLDLSKVESTPSPINNNDQAQQMNIIELELDKVSESIKGKTVKDPNEGVVNQIFIQNNENNNIIDKFERETKATESTVNNEGYLKYKEEIEIKDDIIKNLEEDNKQLRNDVKRIKDDLEDAKLLLENTRAALNAKMISSPAINLELERALEDLKDSKEINTSLQLQIDTLNKTHQHLKSSYDDLLGSNKNLERRMVELDSMLDKYKTELFAMQRTRDKLLDVEGNLNKMLETEKLQTKSLKLQNEKDAKCIQDLNRQIKEMERIIARKHPDSVSALIVAAKKDETDSNLSARKLLEDRIKLLEQEAVSRDNQSSKIFVEIQDKFNQMKLKYESHIEDLELHVSDLKTQLKKKVDTFDVYTQTTNEEQKIPEKESHSIQIQTDPIPIKPPKVVPVKVRNEKVQEVKAETHLIATIRGLQTDLCNKEKVINRLQKDIDELRKTNRRLQKEREGSLRSLNDKREFRSYPEKLAQANSDYDEDVRILKNEKEKLQKQLRRAEEDYQNLKEKRIFDLTTLQEAHECEMSNYMSNITPLREQLEVQQVSISTLQQQLTSCKEELAIVTVERDHLNKRLLGLTSDNSFPNERDVDELQRKIAYLETRYEEREHRLRAIVHGLAQKNVTNRSCEQCAERQLQLIGYKNELDQILATVRALQ